MSCRLVGLLCQSEQLLRLWTFRLPLGFMYISTPKSSSFYSVLRGKVQGLKSSLSWHLNYSCPFLPPALVLISYFKLKKYNGQEPEEQRKVLFFRLSLSESLSAPLQAHAVCYLHLVKTSSDSYLWLLYCKSLFSLITDLPSFQLFVNWIFFYFFSSVLFSRINHSI